MNIVDNINEFHKNVIINHDLERRFWFTKDDEKYDGATWILKIYFFGFGLFKQDFKKTRYRIVNCRKVGVMLKINIKLTKEEQEECKRVFEEAFGK